MIITLCQRETGVRIDIKVNREQKITDTLVILLDGGILEEKGGLADNRIYSERKEKYIDAEQTYQQAGIYNGDILYVT